MFQTPDLSGVNPDYRIDNDAYVITTTDQKLEFNTPIFADSIEMILIGSGSIRSPLVRDTDWTIKDDDKDWTSMSKMKLQTLDFDKLLIKSITVIKTIAAPIKINMQYQKLYPVMLRTALVDGKVLNITPPMLLELFRQVEYLTNLTAPVTDTTSITDATPLLLEPDPYLEHPENIITNEIHEINVPGGRYFIHPACGAFFNGTESLVVESTDEVLREGIDYKVIGMHIGKTKVTVHKPGVYTYIWIMQPIAGKIRVGYRAYGGEVTVYDLRVIEDELTNTIKFLNATRYLTSDTVGDVDIIKHLAARVTTMEELMRILSNKPSYGDSTHGKAVKRRIAADGNKLHWWSIASLYTVGTDPTPYTADAMKLRIQTDMSHIQFDTIVSVDLNNPGNKLTVSVLAENYPMGYVPFVEYGSVDQIIRPQFRLIWNDNPTQISGCLLQIGFELKWLPEENIGIEDQSGIESAWKLIDPTPENVHPDDDQVVLPNPGHLWSMDNVDSRMESTLMPFKGGYLAYAGIETLNRPITGWKTVELQHYLTDNIDISRITKMRLDLKERDGACFPVDIEFTTSPENRVVGVHNFFYNGKLAYVLAQIFRAEPNPAIPNDPGKIRIVLQVNIEAGVSAPELDLYHVLVYA